MLGLDLGQRRDHSALAVVERIDLVGLIRAPVFHSFTCGMWSECLWERRIRGWWRGCGS